MIDELRFVQRRWISLSQQSSFAKQISLLKKKQSLPKKDALSSLNPFLDSQELLRVGARVQLSNVSSVRRHPIILPSKHPVTKMIIHTEHLRLLHAGFTLTAASLSSRYHIVGARKVIRSLVRACVVCNRVVARPQPQLLGQLPKERLSPRLVFEHVGVDYAGPLLIKQG